MHAVRTPAGARIWGFASETVDIEQIQTRLVKLGQDAELPYQPSDQAGQLGAILAKPYRLVFRMAWQPAPALCLQVMPLEAEHRDTFGPVQEWLTKLDVTLPYACDFDITILFCQDSPSSEDIVELLGSEIIAHSLVLGGRAYMAAPDRPTRTKYLLYPQTRRLSEELIDSLLSAVIWIEASGTSLRKIARAYDELDGRLSSATTQLVDMGRGQSHAGEIRTAQLAQAHAELLSLYANWQHYRDRLQNIESELTLLSASWQEEPVKGARAVTRLVREPLEPLLESDARQVTRLEALRQWLADTRSLAALRTSVEHTKSLRWLVIIGLALGLMLAAYILITLFT